MIACTPPLICAGPPPAPLPPLVAPRCPMPTRRYPRVECVTMNGRVIVRVWRNRR